MKKALVLAPNIHATDPGSMGQFLAHVSASLRSRGCEVVLLSAKEFAELQRTDPLVRVLGSLGLPWLLLYWLCAYRTWRRASRPLIVPISQEWVVPFGLPRQIPIYHDLIQYFFPRNRKSALLYRHYLRWVSPRLPAVYCNTHSTSRMVRRLFGDVKCRVCGVPVNEELAGAAVMPAQKRRFQVMWVGSLARHKNYRAVIELADGARDEELTVVMVVGHTERAALEQEVAGRAGAQRIRILSKLTESELSQLYRQSGIVLSTSRLEGFCLPILEGALCGCIPVVPDRATFRENFGRFAVLVPPHAASVVEYVRTAASALTSQEVLERARAFRQAVGERWSASMDEIAAAGSRAGAARGIAATGHRPLDDPEP